MARGACTFRQRDVTAAVKAVVAAGEKLRGVWFPPNGGFLLIPGVPDESLADAFAGVQGDDLDTELAEFKARHGES